MLKWSGKDLAARTGLGFSTLMRLESLEGVPSTHAKTLEVIENTFNKAGIEFVGSPDDGPGVRLFTKD
jgi:transcriptional regulator with XRE-family HTH domain